MPARSTTVLAASAGDAPEPDWDGDCPNRYCQGGPYALNAGKQLPEHDRALRGGGRCPCSGWLARNPRPRPYFYVEGVRYL
jgi:hypothetical protein